MTGSGSTPSATVRAFVLWTLRHGRLLWAVALLLAIPAAARTVSLYAHLRSEIEQLLPREAPSVRALDEMRARSPGLHFLGVVAEVPDAKDLPAAEHFLDDLAGRIRAYPPGMVRNVRSNRTAERTFLEKRTPLYTDLADLKEIRRRVEARRDYEVAKEADALLDEDEPPPSVDITDIEKKYKYKVEGEEGDYIESRELRAAILTVEAGDLTTGVEKDRDLLDRVKHDVADLDPAHYLAGLKVGYASDVAINVEELEGLMADLSVASVLVVLAVMAAIVLYYRWWMSIPVLMPPLLLATVYAFAVASLPPFGITELNSNTAFLGSIIIGNGINVGLILLARYREERLRGASVEEALVVGVWGARLGTLAAAAAAGVSYASLGVTEFRGFKQFGCIGGIGMLASWATAFVLVPPLLAWLDKGMPSSARTAAARGWVMARLVALVERGAPAIVVVAGALTVASAVQASRFDSSSLEYDFNKLRRVDTWKTGEGLWGRKMDAILGHYLTPTVVLCATTEQARVVEARVRESADHGDLKPFVARVIGVDDVLPTDQEAKIAEAEKLRRAITPKIRSLLKPADEQRLDKVLGDEALKPIRAEDLPTTFTTGMRERDGSIGRAILVYPRPSDALWKADTLHLFVRTLRDLAASASNGGALPVYIAGGIPLSSDILLSIGRDAPIASLVSFLGVVAVVVIVLRARKVSLYVIGALLVGVLWLLGATMALGIKINFSNFIAFPITFGIGVDYAVNVMARYLRDGSRDVVAAVRGTGGAVGLCSMTTIIGYSSLLVAQNVGLFLFGLLAVFGEICCLTTAVVVLPAVRMLVRPRQSPKH
ncbi:MAG: efflux RND transporter permease subunit, partial [Polyangiaceae bacterium]